MSAVARSLLLVALTLLASLPARADKLNLVQTPLFLSASATPNVMLLLDNSGSLNNIIWDDGFNPQTIYPDWSASICGDANGQGQSSKCWTSDEGNFTLVIGLIYSNAKIYASSYNGPVYCPPYWLYGQRGSVKKCLKLPDPVGGYGTRYTGNYLNYLFNTYATGNLDSTYNANKQDLTDGTIQRTDYRLSVSKAVAEDVVTSNPNLRFGVAKFNGSTLARDSNGNVTGDGGPGGYIAAACGSSQSTVLAQITGANALAAEANTPLAETAYEITRYFRGLSSYYNANTTYATPIQYSCQKNFLVVITDGLPTWDTQFPTNDPLDVADTTKALPNWDGVATATTDSQYPNFPAGSDGYAPTGPAGADEGRTLFLDDIAKFAYDGDMSSSLTGRQNIATYTIGLTADNTMLREAADSSHGNGAYYTANNQAQLQTALQSAIANIVAQSGDFSSVAANSTSLDTGTRIIQASFNSGNWSGDVKAYQVYDGDTACSSGTQTVVGEVCSQPAWSAASRLDAMAASDRTILTFNPNSRTGIPFLFANLDSSQKTLLKKTGTDTDATIQARLNYLRGDRSGEGSTDTPRLRGSKLGDIIGSAPFYVGPPAFNYSDAGYSAFKRSNSGRAPMVYVGGNDGMLHGFQVSDGVEKLAYVPNIAFGSGSNQPLLKLSQLPYVHAPIVDATPTVGDVKIGTTWKSVLVGGMATGGRGLFALDVTNPSNFAQTTTAASSTVLWEFTSAADGDLGYTHSQPLIVKMRNGKWAALIGNGYSTGSDITTSGKASLFIVYLDGPDSSGSWGTATASTSSRYIKIKTSAGGTSAATGTNAPNGLGPPAAVDTDGDGMVDYIYAGDELGNLWRFDVNSTDVTQWKVGNSTSPLFKATDNGGTAQPITERPSIGYNFNEADPTSTTAPKLAIYFGTGRYIDLADAATTGVQTFYAVFDKFSSTALTLNREGRGTTNMLVKQSIQRELNASGGTCTGDAINASGSCFRQTSNNSVTSANYGWFIDLYNTAINSSGTATATATYGERQITTPVLRSGRIIFTTLVPSSTVCSPGGGGWLMELDARNGGAFSSPVFNTNSDRLIDDNDYITLSDGTKVAVTGMRSTVGIPATPAVIYLGDKDGQGQKEAKYIAGTGNGGATLQTLLEKAPNRIGRITWREIQK